MVLTCLSVTVDGAIVIPWTVCCVDLGTSFSQLFKKLQAGSIELFQPYAAKLQHCEYLKATSRNQRTLVHIIIIPPACT